MSSLDRMMPFLKPIEDLLVDPAVTEVMVNAGGRRMFVERHGCIKPVSDRTLEVRNLSVAIMNMARACGDETSERQPMLDARLEDGSRATRQAPTRPAVRARAGRRTSIAGVPCKVSAIRSVHISTSTDLPSLRTRSQGSCVPPSFAGIHRIRANSATAVGHRSTARPQTRCRRLQAGGTARVEPAVDLGLRARADPPQSVHALAGRAACAGQAASRLLTTVH
jgi:hypothetical protein